MSSNSNLGYTGYLLRKTIQPFSLRKDNSNFNEFREKNMIMYLNKKVSNTREREGKSLSHQQLQKGIHIMVRKSNAPSSHPNGQKDTEENSQVQEEVNLEQLKKDEEKERQDPFYQEVMIQMKQNEFTDDFAVVSEENKIGKQTKSKKERSDIEQTLNILVANNLDQNNLQDLFRDYKKISLKDKLNELKSRHADMAKIQRKIKKDQQKMQEDTAKVNKFMYAICQNKNLTLGKILSIQDDEIQYVQEEEGMENIPNVKALEMLEELIEDEEEDNQKNMIKIFKKTQLDNIDSDAARNKFNMTSFKKKNEQTEKLYQQMAENNKKALLNSYPDRFVRSKGSVKPPNEKVNVFQRLISPEYAKMQEEIQHNMPKKVPLGFIQTEQDKCHEKLKEMFNRSQNHQSAPSIYDSKMSTKKSLLLNTQESSHVHNLFLTQSNYSVPTSTLHRAANQYSKPQFQNFTGNQSISTPQKNIVELSQLSTDQKSMSGKQLKLNNRALSAKQIPNYSTEIYQMSPVPQIQKKVHPHRQIQSMSSTMNKIKERPSLKVQQQLDLMRMRINKLKENKQFSKANNLQLLVNKMEMSEVVQNFVTQCNNDKLESNKQTSFTKQQIVDLEHVIEDDLKEINLLQQGQINVEVKVDNPNFIEFKKRSEFKRKLINYLITKVDKKTDVLSKYKQKQFTQNFLQKLYDGSIAVEI